jgi:hypothetical protein
MCCYKRWGRAGPPACIGRADLSPCRRHQGNPPERIPLPKRRQGDRPGRRALRRRGGGPVELASPLESRTAGARLDGDGRAGHRGPPRHRRRALADKRALPGHLHHLRAGAKGLCLRQAAWASRVRRGSLRHAAGRAGLHMSRHSSAGHDPLHRLPGDLGNEVVVVVVVQQRHLSPLSDSCNQQGGEADCPDSPAAP